MSSLLDTKFDPNTSTFYCDYDRNCYEGDSLKHQLCREVSREVSSCFVYEFIIETNRFCTLYNNHNLNLAADALIMEKFGKDRSMYP